MLCCFLFHGLDVLVIFCIIDEADKSVVVDAVRVHISADIPTRKIFFFVEEFNGQVPEGVIKNFVVHLDRLNKIWVIAAVVVVVVIVDFYCGACRVFAKIIVDSHIGVVPPVCVVKIKGY